MPKIDVNVNVRNALHVKYHMNIMCSFKLSISRVLIIQLSSTVLYSKKDTT